MSSKIVKQLALRVFVFIHLLTTTYEAFRCQMFNVIKRKECKRIHVTVVLPLAFTHLSLEADGCLYS